MTKRILFTFCLLVFLYPRPVSASENDLLFYLPFEGTTENVVNGKVGEEKNITFEQGKIGQGVYFDVGSNLRFPAEGNINLRSGTVEFWVKPNWRGDDGGYHYFFAGNITDARNFNSIHVSKKSYSGGVILGQIDGTVNESSVPADKFSQTAVSHWKPGIWHHLALSWEYEKRTLKIYIDGLLYSTHPRVPYISFPTKYENYINIGSSIDETIFAQSVIDELKIWQAARTDLQIAQSAGVLPLGESDSLISKDSDKRGFFGRIAVLQQVISKVFKNLLSYFKP